MKELDEQHPISPRLDDATVLRYLSQHSDFFIRNARHVEQIQVPHPVRGAVSLVEWHLTRQRHRIGLLEQEVTTLVEQARENEQLFTRLLQLQAHLATASSLQDMLQRLHRWARSLGLAGAHIRLFTDRWRLAAPANFTDLGIIRSHFEPLRIQRLRDQAHYLGPLNGPELLLLLPQAKQVGSVALTLLGEHGDLGIVIFSSRDSQHYQPGMGTAMLDPLITLLPNFLNRWIERR